jgi:hypothetical protein
MISPPFSVDIMISTGPREQILGPAEMLLKSILIKSVSTAQKKSQGNPWLSKRGCPRKGNCTTVIFTQFYNLCQQEWHYSLM